MNKSDNEDLTTFLTKILDECVRRGMVLPFTFIAASSNGSVLAIRVPGNGSESEVLAEHFEDGIFLSPVNCMVLDQRDEAARIILQDDGEVTYH